MRRRKTANLETFGGAFHTSGSPVAFRPAPDRGCRFASPRLAVRFRTAASGFDRTLHRGDPQASAKQL